MPGEKFIKNQNGTLTEQAALQASTGAPDAGKIPALDSAGRLDPTMMPVGVAPEIALITASENLAGGDWVNVWDNAGQFNVRKGDGSTAGKHVHGFVLEPFTAGQPARVFFEGANTAVTGQTPGDVFLSTTPGLGTATAPSAAGNVVQRLGTATSATSVNFEPQQPIVLA